MKIVVAPGSFKESLCAAAVAEAVAAGIRDALPDAAVELIPLADGGEGTAAALSAALGGREVPCRVTGPLGKPVEASYTLLGDERTAVVEMASAAGLALVPAGERNPTRTTTHGVGELIVRMIQDGARRIIVGLGGSATVDGGIGAAVAAGVRFTLEPMAKKGAPGPPLGGPARALADKPPVALRAGSRAKRSANSALYPSPLRGADLPRITRVELAPRHPMIARCEITAACDVRNVLYGPDGAAYVFGPQKGATRRQVKSLDAGLRHLAAVIQRDLEIAVQDLPGAGAAGGLGAGLAAFFGARLVPGAELVLEAVRFRERIADADLIITGEGRLDCQSAMGKVVGAVSEAARTAGRPVIALVGSLGRDVDQVANIVDACFPILDRPMRLDRAMARTAELLRRTAEQVVCLWRAVSEPRDLSRLTGRRTPDHPV